ncbi:MAG: SRPBCC domain-containing protein, partial [Nocardioides sp.]
MDRDASVFKALADPTRRLLLDRLLLRDGQTLHQLESELEMTRFGVMKHLRILEEADLVVPRRSGREKLHFLNPVPVRLIHDRWIDKYIERRVSLLADLKSDLEGAHMTSSTSTPTTQVFRVHIKAPAEAVWEAITSPEWSARYGYGPMEFDLRPGGRFRATANDRLQAMGVPTVLIDGEVLEADPPRRLVQTYRMLFDAAVSAEAATRVTWELESLDHGVTRVTVIHDLDGAPVHAGLV